MYGDNYVYTIDCSSMTANNDSFVYAVNDPFKKYLSADGSGSSVRGGNVRFSARPYMQDGLGDYSDTYYIDMEALAKAKRTGKWLRDDFAYLGDSAGNRDYWDMMNDDREGYLSVLSTRNVLSIGNTAKTTDKGTEWKGYKPPKDTNKVDPYPNGYTSTSGTDEQNAIVEYAMQFLGNPYVWGGTDLEHGTDCSGFTQGVYAHFGYSLPRTTYSQVNTGTEIGSLADAQPGDLLFRNGTVELFPGRTQDRLSHERYSSSLSCLSCILDWNIGDKTFYHSMKLRFSNDLVDHWSKAPQTALTESLHTSRGARRQVWGSDGIEPLRRWSMQETAASESSPTFCSIEVSAGSKSISAAELS